MIMLSLQFGTVFMATYFVVARRDQAQPRRLVMAALIGTMLLLAVGLPFITTAPLYGGIVVALASTVVAIMPAADAVRLGFLQRRPYFLIVALWSIPLLALGTYLMIRLPSGKLTLQQMRSLLPLSAVSLAAIPVTIYYDLREWRAASVGRRAGSVVFTMLLLLLLVGALAQVYWELRRLF